ncbi:MAG: class B sortase [Eubacterium sp.]|nr:class B sortase [Eubacterium sp.]
MDKKKYRIGQYEFDTYEEYLDGLEDVNQIQNIIQEIDIQNPDESVGLYRLIRNGKIRFKGKIGDGFFFYISDIVAKNTKKLSADKTELESGTGPNSKARLVTGAVLIIAAAVCFFIFISGEVRSIRNARQLEQLQAQKAEAEKNFADSYNAPFALPETEENGSQEETESDGTQETEQEETAQNLTILPEYESIHAQNTDFIGWLEIEGTAVNYPVMQVAGDNSYYLTHSFEKNNDHNGTLFLDGNNQVVNRDTNLIIYGHNMKSGEMFGTLKNYLEEEYFYSHSTIKFDTIYEKAVYQVVGVGLSEVEYQDESTFRYYNFLDAETEEEFQDYLANINALSVYGPMDISFGDELLTLSTCNSYTEDGRMFVLAKKVS